MKKHKRIFAIIEIDFNNKGKPVGFWVHETHGGPSVLRRLVKEPICYTSTHETVSELVHMMNQKDSD